MSATIGTEIGAAYKFEPGMRMSEAGQKISRLTGREWAETVREMTEQDSTVGAIIFAVEMTARRVEYRIEPADESQAAAEAAEFVDECLDDLDAPWPTKLAEILSFVPYGYGLFEMVYKTRGGINEKDPSRNSLYDDGKIGWRKWSYRAPETAAGWVYDDGDLVAFKQYSQTPGINVITIPLEKCMLFRAGSRYSDPDGDSIMRRAYQSWVRKNELENAEVIGTYRDLAGMLLVRAPDSILRAATAADRSIKTEVMRTIRNVHRGNAEGLLFPSDRDNNNNLKWDAELLSSGGSRQFDTSKIVDRYKTDIAMTLLADFILIGHQNVGTYSTSESKIALFSKSINAWLDIICETITEQGIYRLMQLNGIKRELWPTMTHGDPDTESLATMAQALTQLSSVGAVEITDEVRAAIHELAGLPAPSGDPVQKEPDIEVMNRMVKEALSQVDALPAGTTPPPPAATETT